MKLRSSKTAICFLSLVLLAGWLVSSLPAQTFLDRRDPNAFRVVSYNMYFDDLFDHPVTAPGELARMISALDADVYNFQEVFNTSAEQVRALFDSLAPLGVGASWQVHKARNQVIVSRHELSVQRSNVPGGTRGIAMALVDLPDAHFQNDLYILNNHFPCCDNEQQRVTEARAIVAWMQDAMTPGGNFNLEQGTAVSVLGDLNIVRGPQPLDILLHGENGKSPDWDGSSLAWAQLVHNATGTENWTWRDDTSMFGPGILDYVLYTDSVLRGQYGFVLNPSQMTSDDLADSGLLATDFMLNKLAPELNQFDHLPLIVDFVSVGSKVILPESLRITRGQYVSGAISDLTESDNFDLIAKRSVRDIQSRVFLELKGTSPLTSPTHFAFTLEASVFARSPIFQSIDLFNYDTSQFEEVNTQSASRFSDLVTTIEPLGDVARFVEPGTGCIEARIRFQSVNPRQRFSSSIDQAIWTVE